jgi:predicted nucleic acid-binding Zn ribbon protein
MVAEIKPFGNQTKWPQFMDPLKKDLTSLKDIISGLLTDGTLPFNPDDVDIWKVWEEVVGEAISESARPSRIKGRRLKVTVSDPIWLQELTFLESDIREKLNGRLGRTAVEKIDFKVGR